MATIHCLPIILRVEIDIMQYDLLVIVFRWNLLTWKLVSYAFYTLKWCNPMQQQKSTWCNIHIFMLLGFPTSGICKHKWRVLTVSAEVKFSPTPPACANMHKKIMKTNKWSKRGHIKTFVESRKRKISGSELYRSTYTKSTEITGYGVRRSM